MISCLKTGKYDEFLKKNSMIGWSEEAVLKTVLTSLVLGDRKSIGIKQNPVKEKHGGGEF